MSELIKSKSGMVSESNGLKPNALIKHPKILERKIGGTDGGRICERSDFTNLYFRRKETLCDQERTTKAGIYLTNKAEDSHTD